MAHIRAARAFGGGERSREDARALRGCAIGGDTRGGRGRNMSGQGRWPEGSQPETLGAAPPPRWPS
jgi:hypothetical protein